MVASPGPQLCVNAEGSTFSKKHFIFSKKHLKICLIFLVCSISRQSTAIALAVLPSVSTEAFCRLKRKLSCLP